MADNVVVLVRFRPANSREASENAQLIAKVDESNTSVNVYVENVSLLEDLDPAQKAAANRQYPSFNFDRVFDWNSTQASVYQHTGGPMVKGIFQGYNTTIFAYGQTGSGVRRNTRACLLVAFALVVVVGAMPHRSPVACDVCACRGCFCFRVFRKATR